MANGSRSEKLEKFYKHVEEEQDEQASIGIDVLDVGALAASYAATSHVHHHSTAPFHSHIHIIVNANENLHIPSACCAASHPPNINLSWSFYYTTNVIIAAD